MTEKEAEIYSLVRKRSSTLKELRKQSDLKKREIKVALASLVRKGKVYPVETYPKRRTLYRRGR